MVDQPIRQRSRPVRTKLVLNGFNRFEWRKNVEFLPKDCVFKAAKSKERLWTETLRGYDLPSESPCKDFRPRK